jgi:hypothetical protein
MGFIELLFSMQFIGNIIVPSLKKIAVIKLFFMFIYDNTKTNSE